MYKEKKLNGLDESSQSLKNILPEMMHALLTFTLKGSPSNKRIEPDNMDHIRSQFFQEGEMFQNSSKTLTFPKSSQSKHLKYQLLVEPAMN